MSDLIKLDLRNNSLTGQLPAEWFYMQNIFESIDAVDLRWNKLNGSVPDLDPESTFFATPSWNPKLYISPMKKGYGLCGKIPAEGPLLLESLSQEWNTDGRQVTALSPCTQGKALIFS
jgi:hypothetical protein